MFSFNFREMWGGVSSWLKDDLEQMEACAQAKWSAEHLSDGTHSDVSAATVTSGLLFGTRLGLSESRDLATVEVVSGDPTIRVITPARPTAIVSIAPDTTANIILWNLSTVGRELGEVVILRAAYDYGLTHFGFVVRSNSSLTTPGDAAKFFIPGDGTGTNYDAITMDVGESLIVRLETASMTPTSSASTFWRVLGKLSV
jgi:hypothetical protein